MLDGLGGRPIVPVIVIDNENDAEPLAEALLEGGLDIIEVTLRTAAAVVALERIRRAFPKMLVGAGTVVTREQADRCLEIGVHFGVAPGLNPGIVDRFHQHDTLFIPGILTPSEIEHALMLDCSLLKFFPAAAAGGPTLLRALAAPYTSVGVEFCPTGGIDPDNLREYLSLPQVVAVGGSWIATRQLIADKQWATITRRARGALATAAEVRT